MPILHIYGNIANRMNDASISYERSTAHNSEDTKYYIAATVNNALYDFDEYAMQDGILTPPNNLKILVHRFGTSGTAPMLNDMKQIDPISPILVRGILDHNAIGLGTLLETVPVPPDIAIGYAWDGDGFNTDKIKAKAYHEFAHASHYRITSRELWRKNINNVVHNKGYGSDGDPGIPLIDLIEMWGYFIGMEYAHRRYGPTRHSLATTPTFNNGWYRWNENGAGFGLFESNGHIAAGFLHDLIDSNNYNIANDLAENAEIRLDTIQGYLIQSIFNQMGATTQSAASLIDKLKNHIPPGPGNNIANYDSLKSYYGY